MDLPWIIPPATTFGLTLILLYVYFTRNFNHWKKKNIPFEKPSPFVGNLGKVVRRKRNIGLFIMDLCRKFDSRAFGFFAFDEPYLVVKSPELVKRILVKDFSNFDDRVVTCPKNHPIMQNVMFFAKSPNWKIVRAKSAPAFSTSRMKSMFSLILNESNKMAEYLSKFANVANVEAKEICAKYSTNVVAKCAFAIDAHSFDNDNSEFRKIGRQMFDFRFSTTLRQVICWFSPKLVDLFNISFFENSVINRLADIFTEVLYIRMTSNVSQGNTDLIDVLLDSKNKGIDMPEEAMVGSALQFFGAGFETVASTLSFALYELTLRQDIQEKLRQEIIQSVQENDGLTYEGIAQMKYMDQCVSETLRKYPTLPFLSRLCRNDYKVDDSLVIEKKTKIFIPLFGLHYDPKYFPNPEKFDPERFKDKSGLNSDGLYYIPFGDGPRTCIGSRFGIMGVKTGIATILQKFKLEKSDKTPEPIVYAPQSTLLQSTVGIPIKFVPLDPIN